MHLVSEHMVHLCSPVSQDLCFTTICWHTYDISVFLSFFLSTISTDYHSSMSVTWFGSYFYRHLLIQEETTNLHTLM
jgi:hypothetical protein